MPSLEISRRVGQVAEMLESRFRKLDMGLYDIVVFSLRQALSFLLLGYFYWAGGGRVCCVVAVSSVFAARMGEPKLSTLLKFFYGNYVKA